jgi:hypothetical protein
MSTAKEKLRHLTHASLGSLGEAIYRHAMTTKGHSVISAHYDSFDFIVDGQRHVDVKSTRSDRPKRITGNSRLAGIEHSYVVFDCKFESSPVRVYDNDLRLLYSVSVNILDEILTKRPISVVRLNGRKEYWQSLFPRNVKVVYRSSASTTQQRMAKQKWGPQAFYEPSTGRYDWVVLILEDSGRFHHAEAYPLSAQHEIHFFPVNTIIKSKPAHLMTYEPGALDEKFLFREETTLLEDISHRFNRPLGRA